MASKSRYGVVKYVPQQVEPEPSYNTCHNGHVSFPRVWNIIAQVTSLLVGTRAEIFPTAIIIIIIIIIISPNLRSMLVVLL